MLDKKLTDFQQIQTAHTRKMLSWFRSSVSPETSEAAKPKGQKVLVDKEYIDEILKLALEQQERLKAIHSNEVARAESLAKLQGIITDNQQKILDVSRSQEIQKEIDTEAVAAKKDFGVRHIDIPSNDLPLPRIWDKDSSKLLITFDDDCTLTLDISAAKTFYALSMTHDASTSEVETYCTLQIKDTDGEFSFGFPMIPEGIEQAMNWFKELQRLLKA